MSTFTMKQGKTWEQPLTWLDENDDPVDLTEASLQFQVRADWADAEAPSTAPIVDLSIGSGITLVGNDIVLRVEATATEAIPAATYLCELEVTFPGGDIEQVMLGNLTVEPEVVR